LSQDLRYFFSFIVGKYFGGKWIGGMGCLDGHKYVCLDDLFMDVLDQKCLDYSFGINNEWSKTAIRRIFIAP